MSRVYFDTFRYFFTIFFCLFFYSEFAFAAGSSYGGPIIGIASFPAKDNWVYFHVDVANIQNPPNCMDTSQGYQYLISTAEDPSKTLLSNLQIAFSNYSRVWIFGTGKCNGYGSEFISSANVVSKALPTYPTAATSMSLGESGLVESGSSEQKPRKLK